MVSQTFAQTDAEVIAQLVEDEEFLVDNFFDFEVWEQAPMCMPCLGVGDLHTLQMIAPQALSACPVCSGCLHVITMLAGLFRVISRGVVCVWCGAG